MYHPDGSVAGATAIGPAHPADGDYTLIDELVPDGHGGGVIVGGALRGEITAGAQHIVWKASGGAIYHEGVAGLLAGNGPDGAVRWLENVPARVERACRSASTPSSRTHARQWPRSDVHRARSRAASLTDVRARVAHERSGTHRGFSRTSKRRSSRFGTPNRGSPYGNGFVMPVRAYPRRS